MTLEDDTTTSADPSGRMGWDWGSIPEADYAAIAETGCLLLVAFYICYMAYKFLMTGLSSESQPTIGVYHILRVIAVMHYVYAYYYTKNTVSFLQNISEWGFASVSFLVVLSGFVLTYQHGKDVSAFKKKEFYIKRLARWPLLLGAIFLQGYAEPEIAFGTWARVKRAGITLGCIQGWWNERYFKENIPLWAPSVFAFLVFLFPTLLGMVTGMTAFQRVSKVKIIAFFWVLSFVLTYFLVDTDPEKLTWGKASPFMYVPQFLMGMFTGELFNTRPDYDVKPNEILMSRFGGAGGLFVIFICMMFIPTFEPMGREGESFSQIEMVMNHWNYFGTLAPLYCFTLYWLGNGKDIVAKFFSFKVIWVFGAVAPSVWLFFVPAMEFAKRCEGQVTGTTDFIFLGTMVITAIFAYFIVEVPFYRWILESHRTENFGKTFGF